MAKSPFRVIDIWRFTVIAIATAAVTNGTSVVASTMRTFGGGESSALVYADNFGRWLRPVRVLDDVASVSTTTSLSLVIKKDGTMWASGGGSGSEFFVQEKAGTVPWQVASGVLASATDASTTFFIKSDHTLWAVGVNNFGQIGDGTTTVRNSPVQVATDVSFVDIKSGTTHFIKTDGTLWGMGSNGGKLGDGTTVNRLTPVRITDRVTTVSTGSNFTTFVRSDGTLWITGAWRALNTGLTSTPVQLATGVRTVSAGDNHILAIKTDGSMWAAGQNFSGKLGDGSTTERTSLVQVAVGVSAVSGGRDHSLFVKSDGSVWAMGLNDRGQLGDGTLIDRSTPVQVAKGGAGVAAVNFHSFIMNSDGSLWAMGSGSSLFADRSVPLDADEDVASVSVGIGFKIYVKKDGTLWGAGNPRAYGFQNSANTGRVQIASDVASASAGGGHILFLKTDGSLWGVGRNDYGQIGNGGTAYVATPYRISEGVITMSAAGSSDIGTSFFLKADRTLWAMGENSSGQLGDGTTTNRAIPVQIATDVLSVSAGTLETTFIKVDGSLWAMGSFVSPQLLPGNRSPTPLQLDTDVIAVASSKGAFSTLQGAVTFRVWIKRDGSVWGAGSNANGQLGAGLGSNFTRTPTRIANGASAVAVGESHVLLLRPDRSAWALGGNTARQLGDGTKVDSRNIPVAIATGCISIAAGYDSSAIIVSNDPLPVNTAKLSNLSVRTSLEAAQTLIVGFSMQGGGKPVLIRAVGPGLTPLGVTGVMTDPRMSLFSGSTQLDANDNWGGTVNLSSTFARVGAFPIPASSLDAAILRNINGAHTVQISGTGTGTVLVEAYDAGDGISPRFSNISARNRVGTGGNILIAGFNIAGEGNKRLLIRAVGPTLVTFGITNPLGDPKLEIFSGTTRIALNDTWDASLADVFAAVGAFPLTGGSKDAALSIDLQPGSYTIQVSGTDGGTGEAIIELYELP